MPDGRTEPSRNDCGAQGCHHAHDGHERAVHDMGLDTPVQKTAGDEHSGKRHARIQVEQHVHVEGRRRERHARHAGAAHHEQDPRAVEPQRVILELRTLLVDRRKRVPCGLSNCLSSHSVALPPVPFAPVGALQRAFPDVFDTPHSRARPCTCKRRRPPRTYPHPPSL